MPLTPTGKRRILIAQAALDPMSEQAGQFDETGLESGNIQMNNDPVLEDPAKDLENQVNQIEKEQNKEQTTDNGDDIRKTVFDFLVDLGYPPRRLQEFKSQFVSETGNADSGPNVTVLIPDEVYGKNVQIPRDKIKNIVNIIESKHDLYFQTYERKNEQLTLNFISSDAAEQQQSEEDEGPSDVLDKVYGSIGNGNNSQLKAKTIQEIIKEGKEKQYHLLKKVLGEK